MLCLALVDVTTYFLTALAGLLTGAGLIIAIGPQNVFVLRQGVRREHVPAVVAVCAVSDVVLIVAGVAGLGALVAAHPGAVTFAKLAGGAYVLALGVLAARRALRGTETLEAGAEETGAASRWAAIATVLALTWLNPHVYLDTVLTLGAIANSHGNAKWAFAIGCCVASIVWFCALGYGAGKLSRFFASARAWRVLDAVVAAVMFAMGAMLIATV